MVQEEEKKQVPTTPSPNLFYKQLSYSTASLNSTSTKPTSSPSSSKYSFFYYLLIWIIHWKRGVFDAIGNIFSFFTCRLFSHHEKATIPNDLSGKTVVITGANAGLGAETARAVAKRGARVIFACRNAETAGQTMDSIAKEELGVKRENLIYVQLDLASLASVRKAALTIRDTCEVVDVLINNGGVMMTPKLTTAEGHEYQMATNYLGHFLLTMLLIDKLKKSPSGGRVVTVSSLAFMLGKSSFDDFNLDRSYNSLSSYSRSKLYQILVMTYMAQKLGQESKSPKLYAVHPGIVDTGIAKHSPCALRWLVRIFHRMVMASPEVGSQTTLHCAFSEEAGREASGGYYENCKNVSIPKHATDAEDAEYLWKLSCRLCNLEDNNNLL